MHFAPRARGSQLDQATMLCQLDTPMGCTYIRLTTLFQI